MNMLLIIYKIVCFIANSALFTFSWRRERKWAAMRKRRCLRCRRPCFEDDTAAPATATDADRSRVRRQPEIEKFIHHLLLIAISNHASFRLERIYVNSVIMSYRCAKIIWTILQIVIVTANIQLCESKITRFARLLLLLVGCQTPQVEPSHSTAIAWSLSQSDIWPPAPLTLPDSRRRTNGSPVSTAVFARGGL